MSQNELPLYYANVFLYVCPPKTFLKSKFLIIFCNYHEVRGLGKKLIILVIERELLVYTRGMGAMHFIFKSQSKDAKENLRGGILRDRKKMNMLLIVFATW